MRAYEILSEGGIDALALNQRPSPRPGFDEILIDLRASSINYRDLSTIENPAARAIPYPRIPNSDGAGVVVEVGDGVTSFAPGDHVAGCFFQDWSAGAIDAAAMASAAVRSTACSPNGSSCASRVRCGYPSTCPSPRQRPCPAPA